MGIQEILVFANNIEIERILSAFCETENIVMQRVFAKEHLMQEISKREYKLLLFFVQQNEQECIEDILTIHDIRRKSTLPIIALSENLEANKQIHVLNAGADDFVNLPMNPLELYARMKSQLRRYEELTYQKEETVFKNSGIEIDDVSRRVTIEGRQVDLTSIEYRILRLLVRGHGKVFTAREIYTRIWGTQPLGADNTIAVHIRHIRLKIEENPSQPKYLKVVWGKGYRIE